MDERPVLFVEPGQTMSQWRPIVVQTIHFDFENTAELFGEFRVNENSLTPLVPNTREDLIPGDPERPRRERFRRIIFINFSPQDQIGFLHHIARPRMIPQQRVHIPIQPRLVLGEVLYKLFGSVFCGHINSRRLDSCHVDS